MLRHKADREEAKGAIATATALRNKEAAAYAKDSDITIIILYIYIYMYTYIYIYIYYYFYSKSIYIYIYIHVTIINPIMYRIRTRATWTPTSRPWARRSQPSRRALRAKTSSSNIVVIYGPREGRSGQNIAHQKSQE